MISKQVESFFQQQKSLSDIFRRVADVGAASAPILDNVCCKALLAEVHARRYVFTPELYEQGKEGAKVYQNLETVTDFPEDSEFTLLKDTFEACLDAYADSLSPYPFSLPPLFNSITLARYLKGSIGITPHLDHLKYKNLICIFILQGKARFFICSDRLGSGAKEIDASVGNVIFLRCPGFMGISKRPFHFLAGIDETRYSFILRQEDGGYVTAS